MDFRERDKVISIMSIFRRAADKTVAYAKSMYHDYSTVMIETAQGAKNKPLKAAFYTSCLVGLGYAFKTNPNKTDLNARLCELRQELALLPVVIHNTNADTAINNYTDLTNTDRLDLYDCWFFSLLLKREYDRTVFSPVSQDSNLSDWPWTNLHKNFVDIGAFGRFFMLDKAFIDYDIKEEEFQTAESNVIV